MARIELDIEYLRTRLRYEPESGKLYWLAARYNKRRVGLVAGCMDKEGYITVKVDRRQCRAHRICWAIQHGFWPPDQVDHINGIRSDNRIANLRLADQYENNQNQSWRGHGVSGLRGAAFVSKEQKFRASIKHRGATRHLGSFDTAEEAHRAYMEAKASIHEFSPFLRDQ